MFHWLRRLFANSRGYRDGYRRGRKTGLAEAQLEAELLKQQAAEAAAKITQQAEATAEANARLLVDERFKLAELEIEVSRRKAREKAREEGQQEGYQHGIKRGELLGYQQKAKELGLLVLPEVPSEYRNLGHVPHGYTHCNVYHSPRACCYIVRLIFKGELGRACFEWESEGWQDDLGRWHSKTVDDAMLIHAVAYRNRFMRETAAQELLGLVIREVEQQHNVRRADLDFYARNLLRLCHEYHLQAKEQGANQLFTTQPIWVGDAPEARLNLEQPEIVTRPWEVLWDHKVPEVWQNAMEYMGLEGRTLRDLLLCEAHEFDACSGIGPKMLRQLRDRLAARKLYLWGEGPGVVLASHPAGERNTRSIELDGWRENDLDGRQTTT